MSMWLGLLSEIPVLKAPGRPRPAPSTCTNLYSSFMSGVLFYQIKRFILSSFTMLGILLSGRCSFVKVHLSGQSEHLEQKSPQRSRQADLLKVLLKVHPRLGRRQEAALEAAGNSIRRQSAPPTLSGPVLPAPHNPPTDI